MKLTRYVFITLVSFIFISGCVTTNNWRHNADEIVQVNSNYNIAVTPIMCETDPMKGDVYHGCQAINLVITNNTNEDIEIDWNKTAFISGGTTKGGFMFEGIIYADRNKPKPADIIFSNSTLEKIIYPNNLVVYVGSGYGWGHYAIGDGKHGVYLVMNINNEQVKVKAMFNLYEDSNASG